MQACKPGSVPNKSGSYHLSSPDVAIRVNQPTHPGIRLPENDQSKSQDLFGLSTRKVCHAPAVTGRAVSSYLTFSPFPSIHEGSLFSVALSVGAWAPPSG